MLLSFFHASAFLLFFPLSVPLSPAVNESVYNDHRLSSCPVTGCCVILGAVNNGCCRVDGRATQREVLIGGQQDGRAAMGQRGGHLFGTLSVNGIVTLPTPSYPWQRKV